MGRHAKYKAPKATGANGMSYADHIRKAFKRGAMDKHEKLSDYFGKNGQLKKQKPITTYDKK